MNSEREEPFQVFNDHDWLRGFDRFALDLADNAHYSVEALAAFREPPILNHRKEEVGRIRPAFALKP